ncbi:MAG: hypothetical protein M3Q45_02320, partial [Chloroflexota bacterium]|nr:hypothetical protein [Chloroflexota bacterium]
SSHYALRTTHYISALSIATSVTILAALTLPAYYTNPTARDNYAGVARSVAVLGDPITDLVLLNAPGQQEVWRYYDPGLPVLALPQQRPPNPEQTIATLSTAVADRRNIFALFWATDEADPTRIVERWLDQQAFKGLESWQGNLRFVSYRLPNQLVCALLPNVQFEQQIALIEQCQPSFPQAVPAGEVALISLHWQALVSLQQRYKVSLQLLDARNQVIAQRDSEPGGGSQPTNAWQPQITIVDNHGLMIPPGTPPGDYRLIVALYDPTTNRRLHVGEVDWAVLGYLTVEKPARPFPLDIVPMQHRLNIALGPVTLVGYDAYRQGFAHAPTTPIRPGEPVHFTFYWQAPAALPANFPPDLHFTLQLGKQILTAPLAGGSYPTGRWQVGELVRGEFDLQFDGQSRIPKLQVQSIQTSLKKVSR